MDPRKSIANIILLGQKKKICLSKIEDQDNLMSVTNVFFTSEAKLIEFEV